MLAKKIIKVFIIVCIAFTVIVISLFVFSYLSFSFHKQKNTNTDDSQQLIKNQPGNFVENKEKQAGELTPENIELLRMLNPGKTVEEIKQIKEVTEDLPHKSYTDEELDDIFNQ